MESKQNVFTTIWNESWIIRTSNPIRTYISFPTHEANNHISDKQYKAIYITIIAICDAAFCAMLTIRKIVIATGYEQHYSEKLSNIAQLWRLKK